MNDDYKSTDYELLEWSGPYELSALSMTSVPVEQGLYVVTNSSSPFAFRATPNHLEPAAFSLDRPRILYVGRAANLRQRILQYFQSGGPVRLGRGFSTLPRLYVYWATTPQASRFERDLIANTAPLLNQFTRELAVSANPTGLQELEDMLASEVSDEALYQQFFERNPWVFGLQFSLIEPHKRFDDENIPDFTAVRSRDEARDILEIKQPFLPLQRADGRLSTDFHEAWAQAERYLGFARRDADYLLRRKHLRFENPYCYLILGYEPNSGLRDELLRKQLMNPGIVVITYDQVLRMASETIRLIRTVPLMDG